MSNHDPYSDGLLSDDFLSVLPPDNHFAVVFDRISQDGAERYRLHVTGIQGFEMGNRDSA